MPRARLRTSPFRYFSSSSEMIRLVVLKHGRFLLGHGHARAVLTQAIHSLS
ncbi:MULTISPECIES: hypothetical protein [unclassified Sphingomonas]|jgi:hypothetical protein|uniref:hypothetical protein n=1 Tax=unclassified Sphingomonas TaxID=196159 RepID=UPI000B230DAA|nr:MULTISPECIES: hypothetical protein [unclassified Sphingomonas]